MIEKTMKRNLPSKHIAISAIACTAAIWSAVAGPGPEPAPVAYWSMDSRSADGFTDEGDRYTLKVAEGDVAPVEDTRFGGSAAFSGTLELPSDLVEILDRSEKATLAFWLWTGRSAADDDFADHQPLFQVGTWTDLAVSVRWNRLVLRHDNRVELDTQSAGRDVGVIWPNRWAHVALVLDGNAFRVFLNGHAVGQKDLESLKPGMRGAVTLGSEAFGGRIAHLRVFDQALDADTVQVVRALNLPEDLPGETEPAPNMPGLNLKQVSRDTGYTVRELLETFPAIEEWPNWEEISKIAPTFDRERFKPPPAPGVHPRVHFTEADLPDFRERFANTTLGKKMMDSIRGRSLQLRSDLTPWMEHLDGANIDRYREEYRQQEILVTRREGYHGPWLGGWVDDLAAGNLTAEIASDIEKPPHQRTLRYLVHLLPYEAFRCLIDEDDAGLKRAGAATATLARHFMSLPEYQELGEGNSWQDIYQKIHSQGIGLAYDFAYNQMSEADRADTRAFIALMTAGKEILPFQAVPALPANTTNWLGIHTNMLPMILAIQGERGYDAEAFERIIAAQMKWVYVAHGAEGAPFEGFTKSGYMPWWLIHAARQGHAFIGTEYSKNIYRRFCLHTMVPWGGRHIYETHIGRVDSGIPYMKFAHPEDLVVDMLYGSHVMDLINDEDYVYWPNVRTSYPPLYTELMVADDPLGMESDGTYDWEKAFDRTMAHLRAIDEPLDYYDDYRGVMTARTGWDRDAVMFYMEPRNVAGGHTRGSRNEFLVVGHGREWSTRHNIVESDSQWSSVILVDDKGQGHSVGKVPPGRTLDVVRAGDASFLTGDASWAYSHGMPNSADQGQPIPHSPNDSRFERSPLPWMDLAWSDLPHWLTGAKPGVGTRDSGHGHWREYNPVEHAFRTAGLVRGEYPYVLVIDDFKKDEEERTYSWQMQLADDLTVDKRPLADGTLDLVLVEDGDRRCLVRSLEAGGRAIDQAIVDASGWQPFEYLDRHQAEQQNNRLVINARSTVGDFKTLVYPHTPGMPEVLTRFNGDRSQLTVSIGDQEDIFRFAKDEDGRTRVSLERNGNRIF